MEVMMEIEVEMEGEVENGIEQEEFSRKWRIRCVGEGEGLVTSSSV